MHFVTIPGIGGSGKKHWQSIWEAEWGQCASRISVTSWTSPDLDDWCDAIDRAVRQAGSQRVVLVAHSLGCLAVAHWTEHRRTDVLGVFLVAPPDRGGAIFPASEAPTFAAVEENPLNVPGVMLVSDNDLYCAPDVAARLSNDWAVPRINVGSLGHINSASGLGRWDAGYAMLTAFSAGLRRERAQSQR
jgi:uncharacterized protein